MREAASDVWLIPHERAATKQTAGKAAAHSGFDEMAPPAALLALRICTSYSTRLAPCIRGHLVRNAAHEGFCISLLSLCFAQTHAWIERRIQDIDKQIDEDEHEHDHQQVRDDDWPVE